MSVIVFNKFEQCMYADSVTTLGHTAVYKTHKVRHHICENGWQMLIGGVGIPSQASPAISYAIEVVERLIDGGYTLKDLQRNNPLPHYMDLFTTHSQWLAEVVKQSNTDPDWSVMVTIRDPETDEIAIGMMDHMIDIHWGIEPHHCDIVLGSEYVTSAMEAMDDDIPTVEKIKNLRTINYVGAEKNTIRTYTFEEGYIGEQECR